MTPYISLESLFSILKKAFAKLIKSNFEYLTLITLINYCNISNMQKKMQYLVTQFLIYVKYLLQIYKKKIGYNIILVR